MLFVGRAIITTLSALIGLLFNGYIIVVLLYTRKVLTANSLLLLHLGFVDTFFCLVTLTLNLTVYIYDAGIASTVFCSIHGFCSTALLPMLIWNLCGLNCDRYAAISAPLHYSRLVNIKRVFCFLVAAWTLCLLLAFPPLVGVNPYVYRLNYETCFPDFVHQSGGLWYSLVYLFCAFILPTFLMIFCNFRILMIATYHRHRIISAIYEVTQRAQAAITHQKNPSYLSKYKGKCAVFTIIQLIGSLFVLYLPHFTLIVWEADQKVPGGELIALLSVTLVACSPPINGFVYGVKSRLLRKTFKNYLRKQLYKSEMTHEIQKRPSTRRPSTAQMRLTTSSTPEETVKPILRRQLSDISRPNGASPALRRQMSECNGHTRMDKKRYNTLGLCQVLYVDGHLALHPVNCGRFLPPVRNGLTVTSKLCEVHYPISVVLKYTSEEELRSDSSTSQEFYFVDKKRSSSCRSNYYSPARDTLEVPFNNKHSWNPYSTIPQSHPYLRQSSSEVGCVSFSDESGTDSNNNNDGDEHSLSEVMTYNCDRVTNV